MPAKKAKSKKQKHSSKARVQPVLALSANSHSLHDFVTTIDWKESYVSLTLGVLVVSLAISMVLLFAKGKSMNLISFHHPTKAISSASTVNKRVVLAERSYTVQDGDDLTDIALKFYNNPDDFVKIANANKLNDPDLLMTGQVLQIPR